MIIIRESAMKLLYTLTFLLVAMSVSACAAGDDIGSVADPIQPQVYTPYSNSEQSFDSGRMLWGIWDGWISEDRSDIEMIPVRGASFRLNVVGFLEQTPCTDCLQLVDKEIVGPNRLNVSILLKHPFAGFPQFTGFDVCGGIMFPTTTDIMEPEPGDSPVRISWRYDGGCQLLNPDGYDHGYTFFYHEDYHSPKWNFFIPGALGGEPVWINNPIENLYWPFRLFRTTETRNMFECSGNDTQTYELWLPEGEEIHFGYAVAAHWEPAEVTPVTNPETDFLRNANRTGPYKFEYLGISGPVSSDQDAVIHFKVHWFPSGVNSHIYFTNQEKFDFSGVRWKEIELVSSENGINEYLLTVERNLDFACFNVPGVYPLVVPATAYVLDSSPGSSSTTFYVFEVECID